MQRPLYIDNRSISTTSKGLVRVRQPSAHISPLLPVGEGYGRSLFEDVGDYFTGKSARKAAKAYTKRKDEALAEAEQALIAASAAGTEVEGPGVIQWGLLLLVVGGIGFALTR